MHSKGDSTEFKTYDNASHVPDELFESFFSRYQIVLEAAIRRSNFIFCSVQLLYYKSRHISFEREGSYIDFPDCVKHTQKKILNS